MAEIPIKDIKRPTSTRKINQAVVNSLVESFQQAGQISPIVVKEDRVMRGMLEPGFLLISGNHRLTAAEQLGWETIRAEVMSIDANHVHLELIEVDENLCRAELSPAEKAQALKKRKILWESLKEQGAAGGNLISTSLTDGRASGPQHQPGFAASTAEVTGMSKQAINEYIRIADALGDVLDDIQGTDLDSKPKLMELARLGYEARTAMIDAVAATSASKAITGTIGREKHDTPPEKQVQKFLTQFHRLPEDIQ